MYSLSLKCENIGQVMDKEVSEHQRPDTIPEEYIVPLLINCIRSSLVNYSAGAFKLLFFHIQKKLRKGQQAGTSWQGGN